MSIDQPCASKHLLLTFSQKNTDTYDLKAFVFNLHILHLKRSLVCFLFLSSFQDENTVFVNFLYNTLHYLKNAFMLEAMMKPI